MNRAALCALHQAIRGQTSILAVSRKCGVPRLNNTVMRSLVEFSDSSWAAEQLQKMGIKLVPDPPRELELIEDNFLESPDEKIIKLVDEVLALNVVEMCQFQRRFQRRLGIDRKQVEQAFVHAQAAQNMVFAGHVPGGDGGGIDPLGGAGEGAAPAEAAKVKDAFDLKLSGFDAKAKIKIIKEVRAITGLGLKEAKELVEKAPCVLKEGLKKDEAEAFQKVLVEAGAQVELA